MMSKKIYYCYDSIEGIFTAIYDAWSSKSGHSNIEIRIMTEEDNGNIELFCDYIYVNEDEEKTKKVMKAITEKISKEAFDLICAAACSGDSDKGDAIYRFLILGFSMGKQIINYTNNDIVLKIFNMNRNVNNEAHHYKGFVRFMEIENKILLGKINPKNDVIKLLAPHFADRLGMENFILYDEKRRTAVVHRVGYPWVFTYADTIDLEKFSENTKEELEFSRLWKAFFNTIAIEERKNPKLQRNNIPLRFRENILEFNTNKDHA